jgi:hypothetical protein
MERRSPILTWSLCKTVFDLLIGLAAGRVDTTG